MVARAPPNTVTVRQLTTSAEENARCEASDVIPMFSTLVWKIDLEAQLREAIGAQASLDLKRETLDY